MNAIDANPVLAPPAGLPVSGATWLGLPECEREALQSWAAEMQVRVAEQERRIAQLEAAVAELTARLGKNSKNSSTPPSKDPLSSKVKYPKKRRSGRKRGAQPGHKGARRDLVPEDQVTKIVDHRPACCKACGESLAGLPPAGAPQRRQVFELPEIRPEVIEHRIHAVRCSCLELNVAEVPAEASVGMGPRATALAAMLVSGYRLSRAQVSTLYSTILSLPLSKGAVQGACMRASEAMKAPVEEVVESLASAASIHIDETGWRQDGARRWLWVFVTAGFSLFLVHPRRGRDLLHEVLDGWNGLLITDRWGAYNHIPDERRQLCWAHLIRDIQGIVDAKGPGQERAEQIQTHVDQIFSTWHRFKDGTISRTDLAELLEPHRQALFSFCTDGAAQTEDRRWRNLGRDLIKHWPAVFRFVDAEGVEPTNNIAERELRHGVIWRQLTQGSRTERGSFFVGRALTVQATCRRLGLNALDWMEQAIRCHKLGLSPPSLLAGHE